MVDFFSETDFELESPEKVSKWIAQTISSEGYEEGEITYIFCDDEYLLKLNQQFLNHDTLTDIISFDNSLGKQIHGEVYISVERVRENARIFECDFIDELHRVIIHGILHYCGYKDKTELDKSKMRIKENEALAARAFI